MLAADLVVLFLVVLGAACVAVLLSSAVGGRKAARPLPPAGPAVWKAAHHTVGEDTVVSVELRQPLADGSYNVLEQRPVGTVANLSPDYDVTLGDLLDRARERAYLITLRENED